MNDSILSFSIFSNQLEVLLVNQFEKAKEKSVCVDIDTVDVERTSSKG